MTDQWTRFEGSATRTNRTLGGESIEVYEPTESYQQGEGWSVSYPDSALSTVTGEAVPPESDPNVDAGGTTETADMGVYVPSDSGVTWTDYGESGEATTRIDVSDSRYEITGMDEQFDGRVRLRCSEVNA
jgi:hypothetical protein